MDERISENDDSELRAKELGPKDLNGVFLQNQSH